MRLIFVAPKCTVGGKTQIQVVLILNLKSSVVRQIELVYKRSTTFECDRSSIQTIGLTLEKNNDFCQSLGWYLKKTSYCMESSFVKCFIHFSKYSPKKVINS